MRRPPVLTLVLATLLVASAVALVRVRHESRRAFLELQALEAMRDAMNEDWSRLQLEQATWGTHGRVEDLARERLHMRQPAGDAIVRVTQ